MKTSLLLSFLVLSFAVRASSQNCSSASMNLDCSPSGACRQTVPCGTVNAENILNTSVTQTYEDVCRNNNNRNIYLDVFSSNTGAGQCTYDAVNVPCGGSGQPACAFAVVNCRNARNWSGGLQPFLQPYLWVNHKRQWRKSRLQLRVGGIHTGL